MGPRSRPSKKDANHDLIVDALTRCGLSVEDTHAVRIKGFPDLIVSDSRAITAFNVSQPQQIAVLIMRHDPSAIVMMGGNLPLELKTKKGKLSSGQKKWHRLWKGPSAVASSVASALALFGRKIR